MAATLTTIREDNTPHPIRARFEPLVARRASFSVLSADETAIRAAKCAAAHCGVSLAFADLFLDPVPSADDFPQAFDPATPSSLLLANLEAPILRAEGKAAAKRASDELLVLLSTLRSRGIPVIVFRLTHPASELFPAADDAPLLLPQSLRFTEEETALVYGRALFEKSFARGITPDLLQFELRRRYGVRNDEKVGFREADLLHFLNYEKNDDSRQTATLASLIGLPSLREGKARLLDAALRHFALPFSAVSLQEHPLASTLTILAAFGLLQMSVEDGDGLFACFSLPNQSARTRWAQLILTLAGIVPADIEAFGRGIAKALYDGDPAGVSLVLGRALELAEAAGASDSASVPVFSALLLSACGFFVEMKPGNTPDTSTLLLSLPGGERALVFADEDADIEETLRSVSVPVVILTLSK